MKLNQKLRSRWITQTFTVTHKQKDCGRTERHTDRDNDTHILIHTQAEVTEEKEQERVSLCNSTLRSLPSLARALGYLPALGSLPQPQPLLPLRVYPKTHLPLTHCLFSQVKRSRENARVRKELHERKCRDRERENRELMAEVAALRDKVVVLTKVRQPAQSRGHINSSLDSTERLS